MAELPAGNHHADATGSRRYTRLTYGPLELVNQLFQATKLWGGLLHGSGNCDNISLMSVKWLCLLLAIMEQLESHDG